MKNLRGIIVAAVFFFLTLVLKWVAKEFDLLMGMAYPFFSKTVVEFLGPAVGKFDFCLWQVIVAIFLVAAVVSLGITILLRGNLLRWLGWVLAPVSIAYFLFIGVWGLNNYTKPLSESMKLPVSDYTVDELKDAAIFYRQQADRLAGTVERTADGDVVLPSLENMNEVAAQGYNNLVWNYSVFAGSRGPVKELGWSSLFSAFGTDGVTIGLTGEAAVNMEEYSAVIPFNICHEIAHLCAIAREDEANFAGFLACEKSEDPLFQYSGYLEAFLFCADSLYDTNKAAWQEAWDGASEELRHDVEQLNQVAASREGPVQDHAQAVYNDYLVANNQVSGVATYGQVTDLLLAWYQDQYVVDDTPEPTEFNPYSYEDVFGPTEATEPPTEATEEG